MQITDKESVTAISSRGNLPNAAENMRATASQSKRTTDGPITGIDFAKFPTLFPESLALAESDTKSVVISGKISIPNRKLTLNHASGPHIQKAALKPEPVRVPSTMETFVEGISNRLARKAAEIAIFHPGEISPIYIFGDTSLGKTHLLEGIASAFRKDRSRNPALLMTSERFTSAYIEGLRVGMPSFRNKFNDISAFLVDDIQFFVGKESTQTELLRTIDLLNKQGVQIVFTGNRAPKELYGIRHELIARLEAGMSCEILPPERETQLQIFQQMATRRNITIPTEVCRFVASRLNSHARQLSGALNLLHATQLSTNRPITLDLAEEVLNDLIRNNRRNVNLPEIEKAVCETFGIAAETLSSKSRAKQSSQPRMLAMWLARKYTRYALSEIGKYFGDRSHSTVLAAEKKVNRWLTDDASLSCADEVRSISEAIRTIERQLNAG